MKKILLFTGAAILLLSLQFCSQKDFSDDMDQNMTQEPEIPSSTRGVINKAYYSLGISYDITCDYLDIDATKYPVVDIELFLKDYQNSYIVNPSTSGKLSTVSGATAEDYSREFISSNSMNASGGFAGNFSLSGNLKYSSDLKTKNTYSSKYSYARGDLLKRVKRVYINATPEMLQKYLYPEFIRDLANLTPDQFVQMYGTHVLLDITIGGRLQFNYRSTIFETSSLTDKKNIVDAGIKFAIGKFGADVSNSHTKQEIISNSKKNSTWKVMVEYFGGENSGSSFSYNNIGEQTTTFVLSEWEKSVTDKNATIIEINWNKTYPIYDFIKDDVKKRQIKSAVEKYVKKEAIEIVEVAPLYRMFSQAKRNTFFTTSLSEAQYYQTIKYGWDYGKKHYVQGYVFKKQVAGTVPLYRLYRSANGNTFFTTSVQEMDYYKKIGYNPDHGKTNYILGYVYKENNMAGLLPIYRMYRADISNTFMTTSYDEAMQYFKNYKWDKGTTDYIQGYVLPSDL